MEKKVFVRIGFTDMVLPVGELDPVSVVIENGSVRTESYIVGYEDEDGNECDEEGNIF